MSKVATRDRPPGVSENASGDAGERDDSLEGRDRGIVMKMPRKVQRLGSAI